MAAADRTKESVSHAGGEATVVASTDPADDRPILFVGDIQGCAEELAHLLDQAGYQAGRHRLIPVGDTINRGPDAPGVVALLRRQGAEPITGNHELALLKTAVRAHPVETPDRSRSAFAQLLAAGQWEQTLEWIRSWPHARSGSGWVAVHGGVHPRLPVERTPPCYLANVRYCTPGGERPAIEDGSLEEAPPGFRPWYEFYHGERTVIFGHWARRGLIVQGRVRGLDSGCVYGGQLTGLWWPEDRLVQVPSRQPPRRLKPRHPLGGA
jgi:bis(5'-nucleosyl)-tetraphosphatase (symmetrical)